MAATHLVPNPFDSRTSGPPLPVPLIPIKLIPLDKWSQSNSVPLDKWSPKIWSPYFRIPTACPPGPTEYSRDHLSRGTKLVGDRLSRGTNQLGTNCGGPNVWGPYAFGTKCATADQILSNFDHLSLSSEQLWIFSHTNYPLFT